MTTRRLPRLIDVVPFGGDEDLPSDGFPCLLGTKFGELLPDKADGEHERWYPLVVAAFVISIMAPVKRQKCKIRFQKQDRV